jgi:hypothetical protein
MSTNKIIDYFNGFTICLELINKPILDIQKNIYMATKEYNKINACKYQRKLLSLKKGILLSILLKIINNIKKNKLIKTL